MGPWVVIWYSMPALVAAAFRHQNFVAWRKWYRITSDHFLQQPKCCINIQPGYIQCSLNKACKLSHNINKTTLVTCKISFDEPIRRSVSWFWFQREFSGKCFGWKLVPCSFNLLQMSFVAAATFLSRLSLWQIVTASTEYGKATRIYGRSSELRRKIECKACKKRKLGTIELRTF